MPRHRPLGNKKWYILISKTFFLTLAFLPSWHIHVLTPADIPPPHSFGLPPPPLSPRHRHRRNLFPVKVKVRRKFKRYKIKMDLERNIMTGDDTKKLRLLASCKLCNAVDRSCFRCVHCTREFLSESESSWEEKWKCMRRRDHGRKYSDARWQPKDYLHSPEVASKVKIVKFSGKISPLAVIASRVASDRCRHHTFSQFCSHIICSNGARRSWQIVIVTLFPSFPNYPHTSLKIVT